MSETPNYPGQPEGNEPANGTPGPGESSGITPPPSPGVQFNPQSGYPVGDPSAPPYPGAQYPPPAQGYPQQPQPGYPPQGYPQQGYAQPGYGQAPYGYPPYQGYAKPEHPQANTALIVGIIGLAGGLTFCGVPLLASPFAWVIGQRAKNDIDREPDRWGGRDHANTGMILGIIGTVLLALALIGILIFVVAVANSDATWNY